MLINAWPRTEALTQPKRAFFHSWIFASEIGFSQASTLACINRAERKAKKSSAPNWISISARAHYVAPQHFIYVCSSARLDSLVAGAFFFSFLRVALTTSQDKFPDKLRRPCTKRENKSWMPPLDVSFGKRNGSDGINISCRRVCFSFRARRSALSSLSSSRFSSSSSWIQLPFVEESLFGFQLKSIGALFVSRRKSSFRPFTDCLVHRARLRRCQRQRWCP